MSEFNAVALKKFTELAAENPEPAEGVKPSSWTNYDVEGTSPFCGAEIFETEKEASEAARNAKNAKVAVIKSSVSQT